ncbi:MAG: alpha/beta hydrolase [Chlamydiia bacterium]|nr:alpha/beta hydrolase [Chlamydiia bacterium]
MKQVDTHTFFVGPPLEEGPLPALFYFALSAKDSLQTDPFNQPVQFLSQLPLRIFSMTLPAHENDFPPEQAMDVWKEEKGRMILPFIERAKARIEALKPSITKCAVAGLSRGAFIACHVAAVCPEMSHILGYAPLTQLSYAPHLNLETLVPKLYNRSIRFYIGNHDTRVGTEHAFACIHALAIEANKQRVRNAPIEMIIGPSTGYQGHGTLPPVFQAGVDWLKQELKL